MHNNRVDAVEERRMCLQKYVSRFALLLATGGSLCLATAGLGLLHALLHLTAGSTNDQQGITTPSARHVEPL